MPLLNIRLPSSWHLHQKKQEKQHQQQQNQEQEQEHQEQQEQTESTPAAEEQTRLPTPPPSPLPNELTIAIIQPNQQANIQSTIEARLASTGFKIIEQQAIQLTTNNNHSLTGLSTGHHLIYLLSRSRAIQAWKDLVGFDLPARPGSLRFIFGNQAVWAAENQLVYDLIHRFWKGSVHLNHPNFTLLSPTFPPQQSPSSTHEPSSPPRQEKRVFKFSKSTHSPSPQQESEDDHSQDEERSDLITTTSTTTATTTANDEFRSSYKRHSKIPRNTSLSSSSINSSLISHSTDFSPSSSTTTTTTTSAATATGLNHTKTSSLEVNNQVSEGSSSNNKLHPPSIQRPSSRSSSSSTLASSSVDSTMSNNRRSSITQSAVQSMGKTSSATGATKTQEPAPYTFKARPVPASVTEPIGALSPKMSKAAMLRLGLAWTPPVRSIPSTNSTLSSSTSSTNPISNIRNTPAGRKSGDFYHGVPGHKRTEKISVEATKRPEIEPRMTKTSLLRMGVPSAPTTSSTTTKPGSSSATKGSSLIPTTTSSASNHSSNHSSRIPHNQRLVARSFPDGVVNGRPQAHSKLRKMDYFGIDQDQTPGDETGVMCALLCDVYSWICKTVVIVQLQFSKPVTPATRLNHVANRVGLVRRWINRSSTEISMDLIGPGFSSIRSSGTSSPGENIPVDFLPGYLALHIGMLLPRWSDLHLGLIRDHFPRGLVDVGPRFHWYYLGDYFGILMDEMVQGFPFSLTSSPMYDGMALKFEDPFTANIYRQRELKGK
ncbi:hypothetical protein H4Q26_011239 [Puccinia striiformis f. sp. tritici PST-130]|nr:hypothetical protein H4Q26_011239 [Puccinia striiformis f. sp. tritici PST-130]